MAHGRCWSARSVGTTAKGWLWLGPPTISQRHIYLASFELLFYRAPAKRSLMVAVFTTFPMNENYLSWYYYCFILFELHQVMIKLLKILLNRSFETRVYSNKNVAIAICTHACYDSYDQNIYRPGPGLKNTLFCNWLEKI